MTNTVTSQVNAANFDKLCYEYFIGTDDHVPSSDLYISDLGLCVRKRLIEKAGYEAELPPEVHHHRQRMFAQANHAAEDVAKAFAYIDALVATEESISHLLPPAWGGRFDCLVDWQGRRFIEVKANHPNFIRYAKTYPKPHNVLQALAYEVWGGKAYTTTCDPLITNLDRGGGNGSLLSTVTMPTDWLLTREWIDNNYAEPISALDLSNLVRQRPGYGQILKLAVTMLEAEAQLMRWQHDGTLPDPLPKAFEFRGSKDELYLDRDWRCANACDYCDTTFCQPPKGGTQVTECIDGTYRFKKNGLAVADEALAFLRNQPNTIFEKQADTLEDCIP